MMCLIGSTGWVSRGTWVVITELRLVVPVLLVLRVLLLVCDTTNSRDKRLERQTQRTNEQQKDPKALNHKPKT